MSDQQQKNASTTSAGDLLGLVPEMTSAEPHVGSDRRQDEGPEQQPSNASSALRAEAARRNGSKSRGPISEEGKNRSRVNALRHGLRAETLLLQSNNEEENAALQALRERVAEEFPDHTLEGELLRESLVHTLWQKLRCFDFEARELSQELAFHTQVTDRLQRYGNSADKRLFRCLEGLKRLKEESTPRPQEESTDPEVGEQ